MNNGNNIGNEPISPGLKTPQPAIGTAAPSDPPKLPESSIKALVAEEVERQVQERLRAIEEDDPSKESMRPDEDQQFNNFDKKLEVFGVDLKEIFPGFVLRWINDERDRIPRSEIQGWTFVKRTEVALNEKTFPLNQDAGENIALYVGGNEAGQPMRAFLMKIPQAGYDRLMRAKNKQDDLIEDAIRRGAIGPAITKGGYAGTDQGQVKINYNPARPILGRG